MPKFTTDDVKVAMNDLPNVRNILMVGPSGTGKTCGMDCLGAQCGLVAEDKIGEVRFTLVRDDERAKGSTIKSGLTSMIIENCLFHCLDTPGHSEYMQELQVAAPLADGALYVVDGSKGELAAQCTQQVKMCIDYKIRPVLFCNRLDTSFFVTQKDKEEILDDLMQVVVAFNTLGAEEFEVDAAKGSVLIGSLSNGWAFSVPKMAATYAKKFGCDVETMASRLWGDNYFNPKKKTWSKVSQDGSVRGFVQFVLSPIMKMMEAAESGDADKLEKMLGAMSVSMGPADKKLTGAPLFHRAMQLWMPAGVCIANALKQFVPDPAKAQAARFSSLISGPESDPSNVAVKDCKSSGPMLFQVAKLIPQPSAAGRFYALGRVFSGTLSADKCWLLEEDHLPKHFVDAQNEAAAAEVPAAAVAAGPAAEAQPVAEAAGSESPGGSKSPDAATPKAAAAKTSILQERRIQGVVSCCAKTFSALASVPAGNLCAVSGVDQFILKRATVAGSKDAFPLRKPTITVSPVVRQAVQPKNAADLPKMVEGLRRLAKSCPIVETSMEDNGKHVVAACGQEHMRVLKGDLEKEYLGGMELKWDEPSITYRETVTSESSMMCLSKSPNKHNRLFVKAEPLDEELCRAIEGGVIGQNQDNKNRSKKLEKEFGWEKSDALKIWSFGPAPEEACGSYGPNVLVDQTKAVQYLHEIKESVNSGLLWASRQGPLCEESMRGIRFNLHDVKLHADSIHRGMGQLQPTARRVLFCSTLTANCRFQEPIFQAVIGAPQDSQPGIMQALGACRGEFISCEQAGSQIIVEAYVPIAETIGRTPFATVLTQKTNGKASANYTFDHWQTMGSDPLNMTKDKLGEWKAEGRAAEILLEIRKRKGLKVEKPDLAEYFDKL